MLQNSVILNNYEKIFNLYFNHILQRKVFFTKSEEIKRAYVIQKSVYKNYSKMGKNLLNGSVKFKFEN